MFMEIITYQYESTNPRFWVNESDGNIHLKDSASIHDEVGY